MKKIEIFTDGACSGNPGPGGYGAILRYKGTSKELWGGDPSTTNNRMELTAVITALSALKEPCEVELYSDSKYIIDAVTKGWAKKWRANNWEKSYKTNIGLEMMLWGKLNLTLDYYWERRKDILIQRSSLPSMAGFDASIYANMGEMDNKGVDANLEYQTRIGNKVGLRLFGNLTYSKNKIVFRDEPAMQYAYQKSEGTRYGEFYGYIAEGYFQSEEEIKKSPRQMRELAPGDIKYKDLNDDGVIDANDQCYLGKSWFPSWSYGMGFNINYHNFDLALFFQGVSDVSIMANGGSIDTGNGDWGASGVGIVPFTGMGLNPSNVITKALDRWTADNPRADAWYPRMTANATTNDNNYVNSTHWLKDGSYLRLKQASLGYTLENKKLMDKGIEYLYFYLSGQNLLTFSKFKLWDPELGSNGAKYPLSRMVTLGMRVSF